LFKILKGVSAVATGKPPHPFFTCKQKRNLLFAPGFCRAACFGTEELQGPQPGGMCKASPLMQRVRSVLPQGSTAHAQMRDTEHERRLDYNKDNHSCIFVSIRTSGSLGRINEESCDYKLNNVCKIRNMQKGYYFDEGITLCLSRQISTCVAITLGGTLYILHLQADIYYEDLKEFIGIKATCKVLGSRNEVALYEKLAMTPRRELGNGSGREETILIKSQAIKEVKLELHETEATQGYDALFSSARIVLFLFDMQCLTCYCSQEMKDVQKKTKRGGMSFGIYDKNLNIRYDSEYENTFQENQELRLLKVFTDIVNEGQVNITRDEVRKPSGLLEDPYVILPEKQHCDICCENPHSSQKKKKTCAKGRGGEVRGQVHMPLANAQEALGVCGAEEPSAGHANWNVKVNLQCTELEMCYLQTIYAWLKPWANEFGQNPVGYGVSDASDLHVQASHKVTSRTLSYSANCRKDGFEKL
ncbi:hypothetical protein EI555_016146, partial [Monodon monoceros]